MLDVVKRTLLKGEFNRNVFTLMAGTGVAQIIPLAVTPILARIYSPEQFGVFGLFVAVSSSVYALATGRYELAIMLPRKDSDAANIAVLSIAISLVVCVLLFFVICVSEKWISGSLGNRSISTWLYFVPLAVLLNGIYANLSYWSNRKKLYSLMANRRVMQSGGTAAAQLGLGALHAGAGGLVIGNIVGQALSVGMMAKMVHRHSPRLWRCIQSAKMRALAKRYKNCVRYLVPAHTMSALSMQLPTIFINTTFGLAASGFYMLAERVATTPLSLVSGSVADVFRQEISEAFLAGKNCRSNFLSALKKLLLIAMPPFVILLLFAPALFALVFGEKWRTAGEYAQLMCPMFFLRFVSDPLSVVTIIAQKNRYELLWQAVLLGLLVAAAVAHRFVALDAKTWIAVFVGVYSLCDLANLVASYRFACGGDVNVPRGAGA